MGSTGHSRPLVVGVDGSDAARDAAEWAADLARVWGAPLHLVHVVPAGEDASRPWPPWMAGLAHAAERAGADVRITQVTPAVTADVLVAHAARARLLVLGSYGAGAWAGLLAGALAAEVVERSAVPVAVVRGPAPGVAPPRCGPVVAGVDGSAAGHAALLLAGEIATSLGARVVGLHAWADVTAGRGVDLPERAADGGRLLDTELGALADVEPALTVERVLVRDTAVRALLGHAATARMIVVGHHGRREVREGTVQALGSTSTGLVGFAPCPVVVCPSVAAAARAERRSAAAGDRQ